MVSGPVIMTFASTASLWADVGTLGVVVLASIASGALAFPVARSLGLANLFARHRRPDPEQTVATLVACASVARTPGFNASATAPANPLLARAITLAASDMDIENLRRELAGDPPPAPRPIIAWAPVVGLLIALCGLAAVVSAMSHGAVAGVPAGIALVVALFSAFFLSAAAGAADDRAHRLDPADVLVRAMIAAAIPAIRAGAGPEAVERILRPFLPPAPVEAPAGRLAA